MARQIGPTILLHKSFSSCRKWSKDIRPLKGGQRGEPSLNSELVEIRQHCCYRLQPHSANDFVGHRYLHLVGAFA
jgi:hypothetical protein